MLGVLLEQIILLAFRKLTHSVSLSVFVDEKGVRRERREIVTPKGSRGYGEGRPSGAFQLFFGWAGKGHINDNRTTSVFQPEVLYFLLRHD